MNERLQQHLTKRLGEVLQKKIILLSVDRCGGGDSSEAYVIKTSMGSFFVKTNTIALLGIFQKETFGLRTLKDNTGLKVPDPVHYAVFEDTLYLVIEYLQQEKATPQTWETLGKGIAALHQNTQPRFGLNYPNFIGRLSQVNGFADTWSEFYATRRILPLFRTALDKNLCTTTDVKEGEKLCSRLDDLFPVEPPALLHGDLWSGNTMACASGEAAIYDPALYYGHREMDIAMTLLFSGFNEAFYDQYNENYPLQNGWQQRVALCQLYPLLVHLILFGSSYYNRVKTVLKKYG